MVRQTSLLAFENLRESKSLGARQELVLSAIKFLLRTQEDVTDSEITAYLFRNRLIPRMDPNFVRPRRFELLHDYHLIVESKQRVCEISAVKAIAWKMR